MNPGAAEGVEDERGEERRQRRQQGAAQAFVRRAVDNFLRQRFRLAADFADTVEENDRVVERVTDQRQERGDGRETDLELRNPKQM